MRIEIGDSGYSNPGTVLSPPCCCLAFFLAAQTRCLSALLALAQNFLLARDFLFRKHRPPAILKAAIARRFLTYVAIKEVVVIGELFSGFDVAQGHDPYAIVDLVGLAVWITSMVHESSHAKAIDNGIAVIHSEEVRYFCICVHSFASFSGEPRSGIFQNESAFFDGSSSVNACTM
jgi:hypothetical protein